MARVGFAAALASAAATTAGGGGAGWAAAWFSEQPSAGGAAVGAEGGLETASAEDGQSDGVGDGSERVCSAATPGWRSALPEAAARVRSAKRVVALTGAGMSAESGVPTYRAVVTSKSEGNDSNGGGDGGQGRPLWDAASSALWRLVFSTPVGFMLFPDTAWRLYCSRLLLPTARAAPNAGHAALADLGCPVVTQNVDGLHQRAGTRDVYELHGSVRTHRHAWGGWAIEVDVTNPSACDPNRPPARFARPDVVLFGESLGAAWLGAERLVGELGEGDVLLLVGTSCAVHPAATLPFAAMDNGCHVVEVNPAPALPRGPGVTTLVGTAAEVLPALVRAVSSPDASYSDAGADAAVGGAAGRGSSEKGTNGGGGGKRSKSSDGGVGGVGVTPIAAVHDVMM